jgi:hypothetical protein
MPERSRRAIVLLLSALALTGCKKEITLQHYPKFYRDSHKTLAIWEIQNDSTRRRAGQLLTSKIVGAFRENGTYTVLAPAEIRNKLTESISQSGSMSESQLAAALGKIPEVDLVLTGVVEQYQTRRTVYYAYNRGYDPYPVGHGYIGSYWGGYPHHSVAFRYPVFPRRERLYESHVAAEGALYDAKGNKLHQSPLLEVYRESDEHSSTDKLLSDTADLLAQRFVAEFAVCPVQVKVEPSKALYLGRREGARFKQTDDFSAERSEMLVRVELPPQADRNRLTLRVRRESGEAEALVQEELTYDASIGTHELAFSPAQLYQAGGKGEYVIELVGKAGVLLDEDFHISD